MPYEQPTNYSRLKTVDLSLMLYMIHRTTIIGIYVCAIITFLYCKKIHMFIIKLNICADAHIKL